MRNSLTLIAGVALLLSACVPAGNGPTPTPTASTVASGFDVYWVADTQRGLRLFRETIDIEHADDVVLQALRYLVAHDPVDPDYANPWPRTTSINAVTLAGDCATIDLTFDHLNVGSEGEALAIQQLLWTASSADERIAAIRITRDGAPVESLAGHVDTTGEIRKPPTYEVFAPIWILEPAQGATVQGAAFEISGMATTFEANVVWALERDGVQVRGGSTTAAEAAPAWAPWRVAITDLPAGEYVISAAEYSAQDGSLVVRDTKAVHVR